MQNLPEVGKTYESSTEPKFKIYVETVNIVEADEAEGEPETFHVEGCAPKDKNNPAGDGIEITGDEWLRHGFNPI